MILLSGYNLSTRKLHPRPRPSKKILKDRQDEIEIDHPKNLKGEVDVDG